MIEVICSRQYEVNSFLVNPDRKLGVYALLNILQDTAWVHATHLGHGHESSFAKNTLWVLTRQKVVMRTWPDWGEKIEIQTWVRPPEGPFAIRDFVLFHNGRQIGECTTSWLMLNAESRRPVKDNLHEVNEVARKEGVLKLSVSKIELGASLETRAKFEVRNSDLDMNQHVNNTRYAQWILDSLPLEWLSAYTLQEYEVNFLAETKKGDEIVIQMEQSEVRSTPIVVRFQGVRERDRRPVFTAQLKVVNHTN